MDAPIKAKPRSVPDIARDIRRTWKTPYFGAVPYLLAMLAGDYGFDGEKSIVLYFLSNASMFRGPDAKRLKAELKGAVH